MFIIQKGTRPRIDQGKVLLSSGRKRKELIKGITRDLKSWEKPGLRLAECKKNDGECLTT